MGLAEQSRAIAKARATRARRHMTEPSRLHQLAEQDAKELLERWREETKAGASMEVALHLDEGGLAASIYRHALIEAGAIVPAGRGDEPYNPCPRCGHSFE